MRLLPLVGLVASLVLTTKAIDDPTHDESVSENPTGRAAVHGHPKVAAGSSGYRHAPLPYPNKPPKYNLEPHYPDTYHESNKALIEEMSEQDKVISVHEFKEVLHELVKDAIDKIVMKKAGIMGKLKTAKQNLIGLDGEATGRDPQSFVDPSLIEHISICLCDSSTIDSLGPPKTQRNCSPQTRERAFGPFGAFEADSHGREWFYLSPHEFTDRPPSCFEISPDLTFDFDFTFDSIPSRELDGLSRACCCGIGSIAVCM